LKEKQSKWYKIPVKKKIKSASIYFMLFMNTFKGKTIVGLVTPQGFKAKTKWFLADNMELF